MHAGDMTVLHSTTSGFAQTQKGNSLRLLHTYELLAMELCACSMTPTIFHYSIMLFDTWARVFVFLQGNVHEVNPRDKIIIASMIERWLARG